jgi:hypothetical protein
MSNSASTLLAFSLSGQLRPRPACPKSALLIGNGGGGPWSTPTVALCPGILERV